MHKKNDEDENAKYSFLTASARFNTLVLNAKIKQTSRSFVGGHLKVEGLAQSHLMPVHRQSYARLSHPQPKTNLAPANESDLLASDWCFHFHTIWIRLFKEITTFLP